MMTQKKLSERGIIGLIGAVQFINVVDFMMALPMGPDFAKDLGISMSHLGWIGGSYTASAAISGLVCSTFLDRFDRRSALFLAMLGLAVGTIAGGFAQGLGSLVLARIIAGAFGGPATSVSLSIIADSIPPERRGRAMGAVMGAFSLASILGVPAGLELARIGSWRYPFFIIGIVCLIITAFGSWILPSMRGHIKAPHKGTVENLPSAQRSLYRSEVIKNYILTFFVMTGSFLLIPNISAFFQTNLQFPRDRLGSLYFFGGIVSLFAMRIAGKVIDRTSCFRVLTVATVFLSVILYLGYVLFPPPIPPLMIFVCMMLGFSVRNVALQSLTTRVPFSDERARFMSVQSAVQHLSAAMGAFISARLLTESSDGKLIGMQGLALVTLATGLIVPPLLRSLEIEVRQREGLGEKAA